MGLSPEVVAYWQGFWDSYRRGASYRYAVGKASLRLLGDILQGQLDPERSRSIITRIESDLSMYPVDVRLVDGSWPYCRFITDSAVLFALISPRVSGIAARDPDLVQVFRQMFDLSYATGKPIQHWLASQREALAERDR